MLLGWLEVDLYKAILSYSILERILNMIELAFKKSEFSRFLIFIMK